MRTLILFIVLFIIAPSILWGQTEIWRYDGDIQYPIINDGNGNIYFRQQGIYPAPDSLVKLNSSGTIDWIIFVRHRINSLFVSRNGVYVCGGRGSTDSINYVNTVGEITGTHQLSDFFREGAVDGSGNLIFMIRDEETMRLLKINPSGAVIFNVIIPPVSLRNSSPFQDFQGPYVDNSGKIWILVSTYVEKYRESSSGSSGKIDQFTYLYQYSTTNGTLLLQKKLFKETVGKYSEKESGYSYLEMGSGYFDFKFSANKLFGAGISELQFYQKKYNRRIDDYCTKERYLLESRLLTIEPNGKSKRFRYDGKGRIIEKSEDGCFYEEYNGAVGILEFDVNSTGNAYLIGYHSKGKMVNGVGEFFNNPFLMQYNLNKKKPEWIKEFSEGREPWFITCDQNGNAMTSFGSESLFVYNSAGNVSHVVFPERVINAPKKLNNEDGFLYLNMGYYPDTYLAKYSIAGLTFQPSGVVSILEQPEEFQLSQNFPNPFNPITTIKFNLPMDVFVTLEVYNALGQKLSTILEQEEFLSGNHEIEFDGSNLPSGVYFYKINTQGIEEGDENIPQKFISVKKMLLVK
ncbi:MAG: T9SS type A sorting domain-containing protein [Bacteroidota bacterium]|nr:T9SS type A sorting domain-containing protein [Bacteroidota bacterium]